VRYGFVISHGTPAEQVEQAVLAERSGWDAVFVAESAWYWDAWSLLTAMAGRTSTIRLGTMLTPIAWRRPWKLASQVATLDVLSGGRAMVSLGLGAPDPGLGDFGEVTDRRTRAERLDDGIDLMLALWSGERTFEGRHVSVRLGEHSGAVRPVQSPPPIWVVAAWPSERSMRRALRCGGVIPTPVGRPIDQPMTPDELASMLSWLDDAGGRPADVIQEGETSGPDDVGAVRSWADAGATWWIESRWMADGPDEVLARIEAGPPRP